MRRWLFCQGLAGLPLNIGFIHNDDNGDDQGGADVNSTQGREGGSDQGT